LKTNFILLFYFMIKVLIIDDSVDLSQMYKYKLQREGYEVVIENDPEKAVDVIVRNNPAIVLLDLMMPIKNWFDILTELKEFYKDKITSKIILFSNINSEKDKSKAFSLWVYDFKLKADMSPRELVEELKKIKI